MDVFTLRKLKKIMDYKKHTKDRFREKFLPIIKSKKIKNFWKDKTNKSWVDLTDDDYEEMCIICNNSPLFKQVEKNRVLIKYNNTYLWCVLTKKKSVIKTIYPISKSDFRKYCVENHL